MAQQFNRRDGNLFGDRWREEILDQLGDEVEDSITHIYDLSDLQKVTKSGHAVFHFNTIGTYTPALPTNLPFNWSGSLVPGSIMDIPGFVSVEDVAAAISLPQALSVVLYLPLKGSGLLTAQIITNYPAWPPAWTYVDRGMPTPNTVDYVPVSNFDGVAFIWATARAGSDPASNVIVKRDNNGHVLATIVTDSANPLYPPINGIFGRYFADSKYGSIVSSSQINASTAGATIASLPSGNSTIRVLMNTNWTITTITSPVSNGQNIAASLTMVLTQDATGSRLLTLPASVKKEPGFALSTAPGAIDIVSLRWVGAFIYAKMEAKSLA